MLRMITVMTMVCVTLAGCQTSGAESAVPVTAMPVAQASAEATPKPAATFPEWLQGLRSEARSQGISQRTLDVALAHVRLIERVIELDGSQPEFTRPVWSYLDSAVSETRIRQGRDKLTAHAALLHRVEAEFGVPGEILAGFWGIESDYGRDMGGFNVIDALATLAFKSRRGGYFRGELLAALKILDKGDVARERMTGSWAGAMGQTQFMPTIFLKHATDYDGNGRRDIWDSMPDVLASTAHFVKGIGWRTGESWGEEVRLPQDFPWGEAELTITKPIDEWRRLGVRPVRGGELAGGGELASVLIPGGYSGPAFLVRENFRVIMRYNPAISYALAVALLADRIKGAGTIVGTWPRHEQALARSEAVELQEQLARLSFDPGKADGLLGPSTRNALRRFQASQGLVADGFATKAVLERLRH
ncbi:membrane-bound lytic murein transglycosylase B [uncultured Gammaproteobacteria bacterium]